MITTFEFDNGKYRIERDDYFRVRAYRHGEEWPVMSAEFAGSKFLHAVLDEIERLRSLESVSTVVKQMKEIERLRADCARKDQLLADAEEVIRRQKRLRQTFDGIVEKLRGELDTAIVLRDAEMHELRAERNDLAVDRVKLGVELTQTRRERDALRAERRGEIDANLGHPDWETASHKDVLDALRFQGATTKALIKELDEMRAERDALIRQIGEVNDALDIIDHCQIKPLFDALRAERDALRAERDALLELLIEARRHVTSSEIDCTSCADVVRHNEIVMASGGQPNRFACCIDLGKAIDAAIDAARREG
jgi:hypothetical protein